MTLIDQLTPEERKQVVKEEIRNATNTEVLNWLLHERKKQNDKELVISAEIISSYKPLEENSDIYHVKAELNYAIKPI